MARLMLHPETLSDLHNEWHASCYTHKPTIYWSLRQFFFLLLSPVSCFLSLLAQLRFILRNSLSELFDSAILEQ